MFDYLNSDHPALIVVDAQNDFCENGALPVNGAEEAILEINKLIKAAEAKKIPIFYSRDWHPKDHCSFEKNGGKWPVHCVQNSIGSEFHNNLYLSKNAKIVNKANNASEECYSAISGRLTNTNEVLYFHLKSNSVQDIYFCGFAIDYCVYESAKEALKNGFVVHIVLAACRGINQDKCKSCLDELIDLGAIIH